MNKKLRIIAGPNGSGKTFFIQKMEKENYFHFHNYVNSDDIQKELELNKIFSFTPYINTTQKIFEDFIEQSTFKSKFKTDVYELFEFKNNAIHLTQPVVFSYFAAMAADFLRFQLLENSKPFEYETVMSHESKIEFLRLAKEKGYKIYLYFICTQSPQQNILYVKNRVAEGGHHVPSDKIEDRYYKTLNLLKKAVEVADITYVLQNENENFASIYVTKNKEVIEQSNKLPEWFQHYYINKTN